MVMPFSGTISLSQANVELKKSATAKISLGDTAVRKLAERTSGSISMSHLYGKAFEITVVNSTNRTQANIHTIMGSPTAVGDYIFENTGTISAATQSGWALQTGVFPAGSTLTIVNRGGIRGGGGNGGAAHYTNAGAGGTALILNFPVTIDNTGGTIWGGGGGGGGAGDKGYSWGGGGGAGIPGGSGASAAYSGKNGTATAGGSGYASKSGAGGGPGAAGAPGSGSESQTFAGQGGYSVQRNGHAVSWIAAGDRRGSVV